jgi:hypothetical protein
MTNPLISPISAKSITKKSTNAHIIQYTMSSMITIRSEVLHSLRFTLNISKIRVSKAPPNIENTNDKNCDEIVISKLASVK